MGKNGAKVLNLNSTRDGTAGDAQKVLLSYNEKIAKKGSLIGSAYDKTQPKNLLDWSEEVSEGDKRMSEMMKGDYCAHCGQKVCRCVDYSLYGVNKKPRTA